MYNIPLRFSRNKLASRSACVIFSFFLFVFLAANPLELVTGATSPLTRANPPAARAAGTPSPLQDAIPTLSDASHSPAAGTTLTMFTFEITYTDADGTEPAWVRIIIDSEINEMETEGIFPWQLNYTEGVIFVLYTRLSEGPHTYYFEAHDGANAVSTGVYTGPTVTPIGSPPELSEGVAFPPSGYQIDAFIFSVEVKDNDNNTPSYVRAVIDDVNHEMSPTTSSYDHSVGVLYSYTTSLAVGDHYYHFEAADSIGTARYPATGELTDLRVTLLNQLQYLTTASLTPNKGDTSTTYAFQVQYFNLENTPPSVVQVQIDGAPHVMAKTNPDARNYTAGVEYSFQTTLPIGQHRYFFEASNGTATTRYPPTGDFSGPTVYLSGLIPTLTRPAVSPVSAAACATFTFSADYSSFDDFPPAYVRLMLEGASYGMNPRNQSDTNYADGARFTAAIQICSPGVHSFYIEASDGIHVIQAPESQPLQFSVAAAGSGETEATNGPKSNGQEAVGFTNLSVLFALAILLAKRWRKRRG
ncbi:MAG: hypothetical protein ACE5OZ_08315 [Candidatus Heimdallarchaeota archaeon]